MDIILREYKQEDYGALVRCMEGLQDYLVEVDPMNRLRRTMSYGKLYTKELLDKVEKSAGIIYIAEFENVVVGCIAGIIETQSEAELQGCIPSKSGRTIEFYIDKDFRGMSIGKRLMERVEQYYRNMECDVARVEVFKPNIGAYNFYEKLNYSERVIDMIKKI